ncbi:MAG: DegT/DnrJ/EryC1/StrS family aminotransferase [Dehalococcoidia bacterium]
MSSPALAIDGGSSVRTTTFPLESTLEGARDSAPLDALETVLSALFGGRSVVVCAGGPAAASMALRLAALGHDPSTVEVAIPDAGANVAARAALELGWRILPVDVEADTGNIAARALSTALGERTRAVVVAHLFGHPAMMPDLLRLAERYQLTVIEDVTASLGAELGGQAVGTMGNVAYLGGGEGHIITSPDVGAVVLADPAHAARVREWRAESGVAPHERAVRAALAEVRAASESLHARRQAAWHLTYELRQVRGVSPMPHGRRIRHGYDRYVVRIRSVLWERSVEETAAALSAEGVPAAPAIDALLHEDLDVRARLDGNDPRLDPERFGAAIQLRTELLAVPLSRSITSRDMDDVADAVRKIAAASQRSEAPR